MRFALLLALIGNLLLCFECLDLEKRISTLEHNFDGAISALVQKN